MPNPFGVPDSVFIVNGPGELDFALMIVRSQGTSNMKEFQLSDDETGNSTWILWSRMLRVEVPYSNHVFKLALRGRIGENFDADWEGDYNLKTRKGKLTIVRE